MENCQKKQERSIESIIEDLESLKDNFEKLSFLPAKIQLLELNFNEYTKILMDYNLIILKKIQLFEQNNNEKIED